MQFQSSTGTQTMGPQKSTGLPNVKGPQMNDRDFINDVLATEKYISYGYNSAVNEASNPQLFQSQMQLLNEIHQAQHQLFDLMHQKGWYKLEVAPAGKITQKAQQFANYRTQFPYQ
ncbi:MAG: spore coat protein [Thermoactinomyces sp.]